METKTQYVRQFLDAARVPLPVWDLMIGIPDKYREEASRLIKDSGATQAGDILFKWIFDVLAEGYPFPKEDKFQEGLSRYMGSILAAGLDSNLYGDDVTLAINRIHSGLIPMVLGFPQKERVSFGHLIQHSFKVVLNLALEGLAAEMTDMLSKTLRPITWVSCGASLSTPEGKEVLKDETGIELGTPEGDQKFVQVFGVDAAHILQDHARDNYLSPGIVKSVYAACMASKKAKPQDNPSLSEADRVELREVLMALYSLRAPKSVGNDIPMPPTSTTLN